jgi:hypothetical protein
MNALHLELRHHMTGQALDLFKTSSLQINDCQLQRDERSVVSNPPREQPFPHRKEGLGRLIPLSKPNRKSSLEPVHSKLVEIIPHLSCQRFYLWQELPRLPVSTQGAEAYSQVLPQKEKKSRIPFRLYDWSRLLESGNRSTEIIHLFQELCLSDEQVFGFGSLVNS